MVEWREEIMGVGCWGGRGENGEWSVSAGVVGISGE